MNANHVKRNLPYIIMAIPAVSIFSVFFIIPLIFTTKYSFYNWTNFSPDIVFSGLKNYKQLLADGIILKGLKNTLVFAILTVSIQSLISLPVSVLLNSKLRGRTIYRGIFFAPAVLSTLVVGYLWKYILSASDYGLINQVLLKLGLEKINFLGNGKIAIFSIIAISVWQWFGWSMVIYIGSLQSISGDLYEINFVTSTISGLKVFDLVLSTTNGGPAHQTETILTLMYSKFSDGNFGYASAFGIVFLLMTMVVSAVMLGIFKKWEEYLN